MVYRAFYDRRLGSVDGFFTVIDDRGVKQFNRVASRSGQNGFTGTSWVRGKSPIPYGTHQLSTRAINPKQFAGATGLGTCYQIATNLNRDSRLIKGPEKSNVRYDIMLHAENQYKGSAGCIVHVADTSQQRKEIERFWEFMDKLSKTTDYIELIVL